MEEFTFGGIQDNLCLAHMGSESFQGQTTQKQISYYGSEDWGRTGGIVSFSSDYGLYQGDSMDEEILFSKYQQQKHQEQSFSDYGLLVEADRKLLTEDVLRIAGDLFIQSSHLNLDGCFVLNHPFDLSSAGLSDEEYHKISSNTGNPVKRVVYYFYEVLQEKIELETGRITSKSSTKEQAFDIYEALLGQNPMMVACHEETPFSQVTQFARIQAIVENVAEAKKIVMVLDMLDLEEDLFELDVEEKVALYAHYILKSMISTPNWLDHSMRVFRNINSCVIVMIETEANHNSPIFVNNFIEALFFYGAYFDCLEDFMRHDDQHRMNTESIFFREGTKNMIAEEEED
ncbi:hypothetical protein SLEP1_g52162 [Rubroshorea leprosula]|uniref:Uncharacterized protein n=1 Tax=Rubroshorea leprosula TaxID=152421 RepID=A0AAV5M823_9ROSI|nr:hypothetical protein SLEP1_g52162 [Rubroshorea leprosula]